MTIATLCPRHGLQPTTRYSRCARCASNERKQSSAGFKAHQTARHKKLRWRVLNRDGRCLDCGTDQDLTVDYLTPLDLFDDPTEGMVEENAETRCRSCNRRAGRRAA